MTTKTLTLSDDEYPIREIPDAPLWSENYAWAGFDPVSQVGHFFSMGRWPKDLTLWRSLTHISLPGGRVLSSKNFGKGGENSAASSELTYTVVEPQKRFKLSFEGPVGCYSAEELYTCGYYPIADMEKLVFELNFVSDSPVWELTGRSFEASDVVGAGHVEQIGTVSGYLKYGNETFEVHPSYCNRDHSRGPRDMRKYRRHAWMNGCLDSGIKFYSFYSEIMDKNGPALLEAAVIKDNHLYPAKIVDVVGGRKSPEPLAELNITLASELGEMNLTGKPLNVMSYAHSAYPQDNFIGWSPAYRFDNIHVLEQSVAWNWPGRDRGYGHVETGRRVFK